MVTVVHEPDNSISVKATIKWLATGVVCKLALSKSDLSEVWFVNWEGFWTVANPYGKGNLPGDPLLDALERGSPANYKALIRAMRFEAGSRLAFRNN